MAIAGSDQALMQCRSAIARSGATRSGYFTTGNAVITIEIDGEPTDFSPYVVYNGWTLSLNLNDEVDTATIALLPSCPVAPPLRSQVKIGLGAINNLVFAGVVLTVQRTRKPGPDPRDWYDLTCIDWTTILDAHLIVAEYPAQSATTTILDIINRFTRGNISTAGVAPGLPTVPGMTIVNERPSTVLRRITNKIGGGFWLDANRVLRAWSSTIPSPMQESSPVPLTDHLSTLKTFRSIEDASQQRTRVWCEGRRTTSRLGVPAMAAPAVVLVPLEEAGVFPPQAQITADIFERIGSVLGAAPQIVFDPAVDASKNPPGAVLKYAVALGGTVLEFDDTSMFPQAGWVAVGGQVVSYSKSGMTRLILPTPPAYGSIQAPLSAGAEVVSVPYIAHDAQDRWPTTEPSFPLEPVASRVQPQGSPVVLVVMKEDHDAAAVIAAREDSDGYYEHLVQDGRFNAEGCLGRANAELADFASPTVSYEWETEDYNAEPGRMQHIALTEGTPVTADVRITNVEIRPIAPRHPPRRHVRATKIQTAGVVDIWVDDPR
jgi:hypothetical protein